MMLSIIIICAIFQVNYGKKKKTGHIVVLLASTQHTASIQHALVCTHYSSRNTRRIITDFTAFYSIIATIIILIYLFYLWYYYRCPFYDYTCTLGNRYIIL